MCPPSMQMPSPNGGEFSPDVEPPAQMMLTMSQFEVPRRSMPLFQYC